MDFSHVANQTDSNQITRAHLDEILIETRYIDSVVPDTSLTLYGKTFDSPIMIAAFSHLEHTYEDGMVEMGKGAKESGICNWVGMGEEEELVRILQSGAECIKIAKPYADREMIVSRLKSAYENGAMAVGMDIDHSFNKRGENDVIRETPMKPVTVEELRSFVELTPLPFIVKGVLSVQDAQKCLEAGVSGILISHHHGITPCAVPPLMILPEIRAAVGDKMDIFVDCGIDTGYDAFKALAMGATAVCVGRVILPALAKEGAKGVVDYVNGMNDQLRSMMARTGSTSLANIATDVLWNAVTESKIIL